MVSLRFNCAVNPFAAHAATPNEPLPNGKNCVADEFGLPNTTFERDTIPPTFDENTPSRQAVVVLAACAGVPAPTATANAEVRHMTAAHTVLERLNTVPP